MKYPFLSHLFDAMFSIGKFLTSILLLLLLADWILDWPFFVMAKAIVGGWIWVGVPLFVVGYIGALVITAMDS